MNRQKDKQTEGHNIWSIIEGLPDRFNYAHSQLFVRLFIYDIIMLKFANKWDVGHLVIRQLLKMFTDKTIILMQPLFKVFAQIYCG